MGVKQTLGSDACGEYSYIQKHPIVHFTYKFNPSTPWKLLWRPQHFFLCSCLSVVKNIFNLSVLERLTYSFIEKKTVNTRTHNTIYSVCRENTRVLRMRTDGCSLVKALFHPSYVLPPPAMGEWREKMRRTNRFSSGHGVFSRRTNYRYYSMPMNVSAIKYI